MSLTHTRSESTHSVASRREYSPPVTRPKTAESSAAAPAIAAPVVRLVAAMLESLGMCDTGGEPDELLDRAERELAEPMIGVVVASRVPVGGYGLLEYGMRASATVADALGRLARHYASVSTRVKLEVTVVDGRPALVCRRRAGVTFNRHWMEMAAAVIVSQLQESAGSPLLHEVRFAHAGPEGDVLARYRDAFGAPVRFRAPEDALVFLDGAMGRRMGTGAEPIASSVDQELGALERARDDFPDPLRIRMREAIVRRLSEGVTLGSIARELKIAPRTLQRLIAQRGSSWSRELDDVRRERALQRLAEGEHKTAEIAAELGFSDSSAFFRAFRRWTGGTPKGGRARKQH
jgi:AraC-like DNA-binding protein